MSRIRDNEWLVENTDKLKDAEDKYLDEKLQEIDDFEDEEQKSLIKNLYINLEQMGRLS